LHSNALAISVYASYCTLHPIHYTIMFLAHVWLISPIGHVYAELELKVSMEQVQVEHFTNLVSLKASPLHLTNALVF
jgi:hypothetical protein